MYTDLVHLTHVANQDENAKQLIREVFRLWTACRLTSHPESIVGEETLGMDQRVADLQSPWANSFPTPPVMGAQLECILYSKFLQPSSVSIQASLDELLMKKTHDAWLTVYLAVFVLLHNCAMLTKRDEVHARQDNLETQYANPEAMRELHGGAETLLANFHGVLGGPVLFREAVEGRLDGCKRNWEFTAEEEMFMKDTYTRTSMMGEFYS